MIKLKTIDCLEFEYKCLADKNELMVESEMQFSAQAPKDRSILQRAILIQLDVKEAEDKFKLKSVCRVIFSFDKEEELLAGKELLQERRKEAYEKMREMVRGALKVLGQNEDVFPDIEP